MKKRYANRLAEIVYSDVNKVGEFTEDFQKLLFERVLDIPSGILYGLSVTQNGSTGVSIAPGALIDATFSYGELESASGLTVTLPTVGTRTDTIAARFLEVPDTPGVSYTLIDVESRTQSTETIFRRLFGSVQVTVEQGIAPSGLTGNKIALATVTMSTSTITAVTDVRSLVKPRSFDTSTLSGLVSGNTVGGDVSGTVGNVTVDKIKNITITGTPTSGQVLKYNGTGLVWAADNVGGGGGGGTSVTSSETPANLANTASIGLSTDAARADHVHSNSGLLKTTDLATTTPLANATTGAVGTSTSVARADHVHPSNGTVKYGGTGADGAFSPSVNTTITTNKNYTSINIPVGVTVTVSGGLEPILIYCQGNATIAGTLTANGCGAPGAAVVDYSEPASTRTAVGFDTYFSTGGSGGNHSTSGSGHYGGGAGGSGKVNGSNGTGNAFVAPATGGIKHPSGYFKLVNISLMPGTGGGAGSANRSGSSYGYGGSGGGSFLLECGGTLTINSTGVVSSNGQNGFTTAGPVGSTAVAGSGGGGGGTIWIRASSINNSGTTSVTGGTGSGSYVNGTSTSFTGVGGAGGSGAVIMQTLA